MKWLCRLLELDSINKIRSVIALIAETIDYFRIVPRLIIIGYAWLLYDICAWYMKLENPTTQQATLVTIMVSVSAAVIGLYQSSGHKWQTNPLVMWKKDYYGIQDKEKEAKKE